MFEFDPVKSAANLAKHGIDFEQVQALWGDGHYVQGPTLPPDEERWMRVAMIDGKLWSAIFTVRSGRFRIISVRRSRPKEVMQYDSQIHLR
jgi:uncharacterized protein